MSSWISTQRHCYCDSCTYDNAEVDSVPSCNVVFVNGIPSSRSGKVDDRLDLVLLEYLPQLSLVLGREEDLLGGL